MLSKGKRRNMTQLEDKLKKALGDNLLTGGEEINYGTYSPNGVRAVVILKDLIYIDYHKGYTGRNTGKKDEHRNPVAYKLNSATIMRELPKKQNILKDTIYDPSSKSFINTRTDEAVAHILGDGTQVQYYVDGSTSPSSYASILSLLTKYKNFFMIEELLLDENLGMNLQPFMQAHKGERLRRVGYIPRAFSGSSTTNASISSEGLVSALNVFRVEREKEAFGQSLLSDFFESEQWVAPNMNPPETDLTIQNVEDSYSSPWYKNIQLTPNYYAADRAEAPLAKHLQKVAQELAAPADATSYEILDGSHNEIVESYLQVIRNDVEDSDLITEFVQELNKDQKHEHVAAKKYAQYVASTLVGTNNRVKAPVAGSKVPALRAMTEKALQEDYYSVDNHGGDTGEVRKAYQELDTVYGSILHMYDNSNVSVSSTLPNPVKVALEKNNGLIRQAVTESLVSGIMLIQKDAQDEDINIDKLTVVAGNESKGFKETYVAYRDRIVESWDENPSPKTVTERVNTALAEIMSAEEAVVIADALEQFGRDAEPSRVAAFKAKNRYIFRNNPIPYVDKLPVFQGGNQEIWKTFKDYGYGVSTNGTDKNTPLPTPENLELLSPEVILEHLATVMLPSEILETIHIQQKLKEYPVGSPEKLQAIVSTKETIFQDPSLTQAS
jgi:hypothetical protein